MKASLEQILKFRSALGTYFSEINKGVRVELTEENEEFYEEIYKSYKPKMVYKIEKSRFDYILNKLKIQGFELKTPKWDLAGIDLTEPVIPEVFTEPELVNGLIAWFRK